MNIGLINKYIYIINYALIWDLNYVPAKCSV